MAEDYTALLYKFNSLKRVHNATNSAVEQLENEIKKLRNNVDVLKKKNKSLIEKTVFKNKILRETIEEANRKNNKYLEEIQRLNRIIRRLNNANND